MSILRLIIIVTIFITWKEGSSFHLCLGSSARLGKEKVAGSNPAQGFSFEYKF
ncbi:MAG TPA: hypothetical protein VIZ62_05180 [Nitrososphaeraceae archaeon]